MSRGSGAAARSAHASHNSRDSTAWRGDRYDMTWRRRIFEAWHRMMGYGAIALAFAAAFLGLSRIGATRLVGLLPLIRLAFYGSGSHGSRSQDDGCQPTRHFGDQIPGIREIARHLKCVPSPKALRDLIRHHSGAEGGRVGLADDRQITEIPHNAVVT
jgi:hypothetical protein